MKARFARSLSFRTVAGILLLLLLAMPFSVQNANSQAPEEAKALEAKEAKTLAGSVNVLDSAFNGGTDLNTVTVSSFTVPAGSNLAIVVMGAGGGSLTSVTFDAQTLTEVVEASATGNDEASIWIATLGDRASPTTSDVVSSWTSGLNAADKGIAVLALSGVDQASPTEGSVTSTANGNTSTLNVTSESGDLVVDAISSALATDAPVAGADQTSVGAIGYSDDVQNGMSYKLGQAATQMAWSDLQRTLEVFQSHVAVNINQVSSLAVDLALFETEANTDSVLIRWLTVSEGDNLGFNLYRATEVDGVQEQLNPSLIPAQAPGSGQGADYSFRDTNVETGSTYFYWLEDVDINGYTTIHGPISATVNQTTAVTIGELSTPGSPPWRVSALVSLMLTLLAGGWLLRRR